MSDDKDPQRISDAADNCEVLRARLAKYEDAEGRPVVHPYMPDALAEVGAFLLGEGEIDGHSFGDARPDMDGMFWWRKELRAALESQARDIERLKSWKSEEMEVMTPLLDYARSVCTGPLGCSITEWLVSDHKRLAAMQSQPSGLVLRDALVKIIEMNRQHAEDQYGDADKAESWSCVTVAREALNSSPISAGEYGDAYQGARQDLLIWKRRALEAETKIREQDQIIENLGNALNAESGPTFMGEPVIRAGVVDERAAFEAAFEHMFFSSCFEREDDGTYAGRGLQGAWLGWQARAALSAPSHGEQVRKGWRLVPFEPSEAIRDAINLLCDDHSAFDDSDAFWSYLLDAAPSAGSQEQE